jgi:hypothetical protein
MSHSWRRRLHGLAEYSSYSGQIRSIPDAITRYDAAYIAKIVGSNSEEHEVDGQSNKRNCYDTVVPQ